MNIWSCWANAPQVASDYSFLNLWAWAEDYGLRWAWEEKIVWIKQTRPETYLWAPIGAWDLIDWQSRLADQATPEDDFYPGAGKAGRILACGAGRSARGLKRQENTGITSIR